MNGFLRHLVVAAGLLLAFTSIGSAAEQRHRIAIQVDQNDPQVMNLALNNATNVVEYYRSKNEEVDVDIVAYGPGLNMLREDTSPVKDRLKQLANGTFPSSVKFSACGNTQKGMEKREGHAIPIVPEASVKATPIGASRNRSPRSPSIRTATSIMPTSTTSRLGWAIHPKGMPGSPKAIVMPTTA